MNFFFIDKNANVHFQVVFFFFFLFSNVAFGLCFFFFWQICLSFFFSLSLSPFGAAMLPFFLFFFYFFIFYFSGLGVPFFFFLNKIFSILSLFHPPAIFYPLIFPILQPNKTLRLLLILAFCSTNVFCMYDLKCLILVASRIGF